jgi:predicted SnoaL-like aldol condensation-catalyzing enzyme
MQISTKPGTHEAFFRRAFDELFNKHDLTAIDRYYSKSYIQNNEAVAAMAAAAGRSHFESVKIFFGGYLKAVPDLNVKIERLAEAGDQVWAFCEWSGTHTGGVFMGVPATLKKFTIRTGEIMRIENNHFAEHWDVTDLSNLHQAFGWLKTP